MGDTTKARQALLAKTSKYEEPYQYYLLNKSKGESIRAIALKFKVDATGFSRYINNQNSTQESTRITHAVEGIKSGLEVIKDFQESTIPRDNQLAQKAITMLEEYYPQMKSIFVNIQSRVLNALDRETQKMEAMGEMDIRGIAQTQAVLKMVNDTNAFMPKTPSTQINIQNNNANMNGGNNSKDSANKQETNITFEIEFVEKNKEIIDGEVDE